MSDGLFLHRQGDGELLTINGVGDGDTVNRNIVSRVQTTLEECKPDNGVRVVVLDSPNGEVFLAGAVEYDDLLGVAITGSGRIAPACAEKRRRIWQAPSLIVENRALATIALNNVVRRPRSHSHSAYSRLRRPRVLFHWTRRVSDDALMSRLEFRNDLSPTMRTPRRRL